MTESDEQKALTALEVLCEYAFGYSHNPIPPKKAQDAIETIRRSLQQQSATQKNTGACGECEGAGLDVFGGGVR